MKYFSIVIIIAFSDPLWFSGLSLLARTKESREIQYAHIKLVVKQNKNCFTMQRTTLSKSMEWLQQNLKKMLRRTERNIGACLRRHSVNFPFFLYLHASGIFKSKMTFNEKVAGTVQPRKNWPASLNLWPYTQTHVVYTLNSIDIAILLLI